MHRATDPGDDAAQASSTASQTPLRAALYLGRAIIALGLALVRQWPTTLEGAPEQIA